MIRIVLFALIASLLSHVPSAMAQSDEVVELFERGLAAYRQAQYEEAERLFAQAHAIEALPDLSYNHARTLELLGRFAEAADVYERFLREAPDTDDREVIEARIRNLRDRGTRAAPVETEPDVVIEEPRRERPTERPSLAGPIAVLGGGIALAAIGVGTGVAATRSHDEAIDPATNQPDTDAANKRTARLARTTNALFVLGGVAFAAGATWLVVELLGGGGEGEELSLELSPTGAVLRGSF